MRDARSLKQREPGVLHAEWIEEPLLEEAIEWLTRRDLDNATEHIEASESAVAPQRPGLEIKNRPAELRDVGRQSVVRRALGERCGCALTETATHQSGSMRQ